MVYGVLLWPGQDPEVTQERAKTIDMENKNKWGGPSPKINHSVKVKEQER